MNYIKIIPTYFKDSLVRGHAQQWRSLESYLEKHSRDYHFNDADGYVTVAVSDRNEAIALAKNLELQSVEYFSNKAESTVLQITAPVNKGGRPKNTVFLKDQNKGMTVNQYKKHLKATTISKSDVVKRGILTKSQLDKAIAAGHLQVLTIGNSQRIDHEQLRSFIS